MTSLQDIQTAIAEREKAEAKAKAEAKMYINRRIVAVRDYCMRQLGPNLVKRSDEELASVLRKFEDSETFISYREWQVILNALQLTDHGYDLITRIAHTASRHLGERDLVVLFAPPAGGSQKDVTTNRLVIRLAKS